jgi:SagB-type dehydrogenase family enzyme
MEISRRGVVRLSAGLALGLSTGMSSVVLGGCAARTAGEVRNRSTARVAALPPPRLDGATSLEQALSQRRSVRAFATEPLTRDQIAQLMWAAQGITHGAGYRTAPSGGALYPLELYAATRGTSLHYVPQGHRVQEWDPTQDWQALVDATPSKEAVSQAAVVFVIAGVVRRTAVKYGGRSRQYVDLEAGHCAQNLLLQAVSQGLGAVTIGAYNEDRLARYFAMAAGETPLYMIPAGHPAP